MGDLRYLLGPAGSDGSPFAGPDSFYGPYGPGVPLGTGPAQTVTTTGTGTPPLMQLVPTTDPIRVAQNSQLAARFYNSLVYHGIVKLISGETTDRQLIIDPTASPLFPGGGLTVRANTPGTYGTFS